MLRRSRSRVMFGTALVVALSGGWAGVRRLHADDDVLARRAPVAGSSAAIAAEEVAHRDAEVAFLLKRLEEDPASAIDLGQLAAVYLQRGRETGQYEDYLRAEDAARRSLALRINRNARTYVTLASALMAQHRFVEAREVARLAVDYDPGEPAYRALLGEVQLELGEYDAARGYFDSLVATARGQLSVTPRLARWYELNGRTDLARRVLVAGRDAALRRGDLPREQVAWFQLRVGDLELRSGHPREAERALRAGLDSVPGDYRLLAAMARLEYAKRDWSRAVAFGDAATARVLDPATLGVVSDAWAQLGDTAKAAEYGKAMQVVVLSQPGAFHRAWGLYLLDHDRDVGEVLRRAEEELRTRRDVYGWDLYAWALFKAGRAQEARVAMAHALALGTQDAQLLYHAGVIERAAGDAGAARRHLAQALAANPYFAQAAEATRLLAQSS